MNEIEEHNNRLFEKFRELNLPENEYVIVAGGPLAARYLRKAGDVDVIVTENLFNELRKTHEVITKMNSEVTVEVIKFGEEVEILHFTKEPMVEGQPTLKEQMESAEVINGLRFQNLRHCLFFKRLAGREEDVKLIEEYLSKHPKEVKSV